jgi:tRNA(Ile)-lysidine synthase
MARSRKSVDDALGAAFAAPDAAGRDVRPDATRPVAVAFSGGLDSTVLLHAAVRRLGPANVCALHVHHGLQPAADDWLVHCATQAAALGVAFRGLRASGAPARGDSIEQWARGERYALLLAAARDAGAVALLTAHHADDQLETVLLALSRGCGLDGLTGIAAADRRGDVLLLRPLLALERETLHADALARGLSWIEDPSNADTALARNAVRHRLLPAIRQTLPGLAGQLADTLALLAEARGTLDGLAAADLEAARVAEGAPALPDSISPSATHERLPVAARIDRGLYRPALAALDAPRQAAALRAWLVGLGARPPTRAKLAALRGQLVLGEGAHGDVGHDGWRLLRHRERLFALPEGAMPVLPSDVELSWSGEPAMPVPGGGWLRFLEAPTGLSAEWLSGRPMRLGAARSSARLRLEAGGISRSVKNLWQESGIPTWLRPAMPALSVEGRLLMAAPFGMDRDPIWPTAAPGIRLDWVADAPGDPRGPFCAPQGSATL